MAFESTSKLVRARTLIHPGAFNPVRIQSRRAPSARHIRLLLQPGVSLFEGIVKPLAALDVKCASSTILGGYFASLEYCVAPPDPAHQAIIAYSAPISAGRSYMVFGNATLGKDADGQPLVHCHAAIRTEAGKTKGGHILARSAVVGEQPISVLVTSLDGFELRVVYDPETNIPLIQPQEESSYG